MIASGRTLTFTKAVAIMAVGALTLVSMSANARFGWMLGATIVDKSAYAMASTCVDLLKLALPLHIIRLWEGGRKVLAGVGTLLLCACLAWSANAALGFAVASRGDTIAIRNADAKARSSWETTVQRAEEQIANLAKHRSTEVVRAELATVTISSNIWQRSRQCSDITLEESRVACAPMLRLRQELATAEDAERLERKLMTGRQQLATMPVVSAEADPQAAAYANLIGLDETRIRAGIAMLFAFILELVSAVGFAILAAVTKGDPAHATRYKPSTTGHSPLAGPNAPSPGKPAATQYINTARAHDIAADIRHWASRLHHDPTAYVPARRAYWDYCRWARSRGLEPCTETAFGRKFTALIVALGGCKKRSRKGAIYFGVALQAPKHPLPIAA